MQGTALWVVQGLLVAVFTLTGMAKLVVPRETLEKRMHWAATWPRWRIKLLGLAEVLGAIGLVAPAATGLAPALTPLAALCLTILMVGAAATHRKLGERFVPALVIGALCLLVSVGRLPRSEGSSPRQQISQEDKR
ncbi:MAG TPA: DoxX family protein [Myxococcaceae bacterium]|nr:DoxX family protein [Myxococcaceae bacterium]